MNHIVCFIALETLAISLSSIYFKLPPFLKVRCLSYIVCCEIHGKYSFGMFCYLAMTLHEDDVRNDEGLYAAAAGVKQVCRTQRARRSDHSLWEHKPNIIISRLICTFSAKDNVTRLPFMKFSRCEQILLVFLCSVRFIKTATLLMGTGKHFGERTFRGIEMLGALTVTTIYFITPV